MRLLYSALFYFLVPAILARLAWRGRRAPEYRLRWAERFAFYRERPKSGVVWFHAVSVGEAEAAFPLINAFRTSCPDLPLLVTTTTPTGSARVTAVLGNSVQHVYLPYDLPDAVGRFLSAFRPILGVILETEIWPNLYAACGRRNVSLCIANGRISARSARGYARLRGLTSSSLSQLSLIAAQTEADADRYRQLGAQPEKVLVAGNVKYDLDVPEQEAALAATRRREWFGDRAVWVAGSTHAGEDAILLETLQALRNQEPSLLLVLAPRHPERSEEVIALAAAKGLRLVRRSETTVCEADVDIYLIDTIGELRSFYACADIAFVGGSLVATGGHNVLEPAALGIPVLFGPHMFHFAEIAEKLLAAGAGRQIDSKASLEAAVAEWLQSPELRGAIGRKGRAFIAVNRGAVERITGQLVRLMTSAPA